jgi:phage tail-like protein
VIRTHPRRAFTSLSRTLPLLIACVSIRDVPSRQPKALLRVNCFEVLIGDREIGFAEVSPLRSETELSGVEDQPVHRFATIVLRRALTTSTELYDWRRHIVSGQDDRRDVTIRLLSAPGGDTVNSWRLMRAWPCRWSGPAFDAMKNDVAYEELELTFEDLVWLGAHTKKG